LDEWWYRTTYHSAIHTSLCEVVYGQKPPSYLPYLSGDSRIKLVDKSLQKKEEALKMIKFHMRRVQDRMKQQADKHRSDKNI